METLTIATYNIRVDTEADGDWRWANRKEALLNLIAYHDWDIFGLQEVLPHQLADLKSLTDYEVLGLAREDGHEKGEYTVLFFKQKKFKLLKKEAFWLSETPTIPSIHPTAGCPRVCVCAFLESKTTNKRFAVAVTHLDHISEEARQFGAEIILKTCINTITDQPVILLGDFNAPPTETTYRLLTETLHDAKTIGKKPYYGPLGTFQDFNYQLPWSQLAEIDYIFVSEGITVEKVAALTDSCDQRYPSDHFPVVANLRF